MNESLSTWLKRHELAELERVLAENEVDVKTLALLTEADLKELGLPFGPRKRLLSAIADLKGGGAATASPFTDSGPPWSGGTSGERRQLTVLFCDMVGFTNLASRLDPEVLQTIIRHYEAACAACIVRYDGYVFQRLGDGVVAFFGYPLAHEGEAERAIRAGLEIVDSLAALDVPVAGRLRVRIGIATGVVVVSGARDDAAGDTMNLAARLQSLAAPGEIVVSDRTQRLAGGAFVYEDLGEQTLKGIAQPARMHRVRGLGAAQSRFEAATQHGVAPFVGREEEIALLIQRWDAARKGTGQIVLVSGEAGIGKSRIVSSVLDQLAAAGVEPLRFQSSPFHVNTALHPVIAFLERRLGFESAMTAPERLDRIEALVLRAGRPASDARFLAALLSVPCGERYDAVALSPKRQKEETIATLVALLASDASGEPKLLLMEDLHWADASTLDVLSALVGHARELPLLVVLTCRPEFESRWREHEHVSTLNLSRLTRAQSSQLVAHLTRGKPLPPELLQEIIEKTDGVPLFVEELTRSLLESGALRDDGERYSYRDPAGTIAVPATLRDSLMARLDRVMAVKEVAQIGAAIGREFSYELIAAVAGIDRPTLADRLARLTDSGLAFRRGAAPETVYTFKHALVHDVAYDSLLKSRRQELHARIADVLEEKYPATREVEPELLARHYTAAHLPDQALPLWQSAGEQSLQRFALPEAIAHFRHGLALALSLPPGPERDMYELRLRTALGPAVVAKHGWAAPEVSQLLEPALALARSLQHHASYLPVLHGLWIHFMSAGRHDIAMDWARELLAAADATHDGDLEIVAHRTAMTSNFWLGNLLDAKRHGDRVCAIYDFERHRHIASVTNNDPFTTDGSYRAQFLWMLGFPDQAVAVSDAKDAHARRRNHPFDLGFALTVGALVFDYRHEPEKLLQRAEEAERNGREHGIPLMSEMMAQIVKGIAWLRAGHAADATAHLRDSIARLAATGHRAWVPYCRATLAEAQARTGDFAGALATLDEILAQIEHQSERVHLAEVLRLKGWILSEQGEAGEAEALLRRAIAFAREQQAKSWELRAATTLGALLLRRGNAAEAHALVAPIHGWFTEGFATKDLRDAAALLEACGPRVPLAATLPAAPAASFP